jgi:hypothetical protein
MAKANGRPTNSAEVVNTQMALPVHLLVVLNTLVAVDSFLEMLTRVVGDTMSLRA